ncbi:RES family NAD+ phosphorylase [Hydrogenophaga sp.]|uniref:RES family NAD+ phosphorylase n=1 Tax=Hydrogenophaga sp. TaxID=1904254 RepID=UPI0025B9F9DE|nr:RES family NAD+ phosphorylase [Hydrogenophaga sp.]
MSWEVTWFEGSIQNRNLVAWRGVEAQHVISTMRLVDTPDEQELIERLLEGSKPAMPTTQHPKHYLLATPFRYIPAHASRFRPAHAKGQWYGAQKIGTSCAEVAYWRHRFILDSAGLTNETLLTEHTFFQGAIAGRSIDLMATPWSASREIWTSGADYAATHAVAAEAQRQGVHWLTYESVRAAGQQCAVVFDPNSLSEPPAGLEATKQTWHCKATRTSVMFTRGSQRLSWDF